MILLLIYARCRVLFLKWVYNLSVYRVFLTILGKLQRYDSDGNPLSLNSLNRQCTLSAKEYEKNFESVPNFVLCRFS